MNCSSVVLLNLIFSVTGERLAVRMLVVAKAPPARDGFYLRSRVIAFDLMWMRLSKAIDLAATRLGFFRPGLRAARRRPRAPTRHYRRRFGFRGVSGRPTRAARSRPRWRSRRWSRASAELAPSPPTSAPAPRIRLALPHTFRQRRSSRALTGPKSTPFYECGVPAVRARIPPPGVHVVDRADPVVLGLLHGH